MSPAFSNASYPKETGTVVLADDHPLTREAFAALCQKHGMKVLGQAADGLTALHLISAAQPDFAILDLEMPGMKGPEVARKLRANGCKAKLIILTISKEGAEVVDALRAGADAYLLKDGTEQQFLDAIRDVKAGGVYITPQIAGLIARSQITDDPLKLLSPREIEVFTQLVAGVRPKDIAELLAISPKTVDTYRASLMRKLKVHDLVGLVKFAIERGLTRT